MTNEEKFEGLFKYIDVVLNQLAVLYMKQDLIIREIGATEEKYPEEYAQYIEKYEDGLTKAMLAADKWQKEHGQGPYANGEES